MLLLAALPCHAGLGEEQEHASAFSLDAAAATEQTPTDGTNRTGVALGLAAEAIPHWLEVELTGSALGQSNNREYAAALLFKVPFRLSPRTELRIGIGAYLAHLATGPNPGSAHGRIAVFDLVFWLSRYLGWYLEPSLARAASTQERTFGLSAGVIFPL